MAHPSRSSRPLDTIVAFRLAEPDARLLRALAGAKAATASEVLRELVPPALRLQLATTLGHDGGVHG